YVYNVLPQTEVFQERVTTATVCIDDLKQALMGFGCLYEGSVALMVNLLLQSNPYDSYDELWKAQYGDGSGNELYSAPYLFTEFQVILFGVKCFVRKAGDHHLVLNPGRNYILDQYDQCIFIAQDPVIINEISMLTKEAYEASLRAKHNPDPPVPKPLEEGSTLSVIQSPTPTIEIDGVSEY
ncbi:hypothetical protein HK102_009167, partial [Quaeritorhiza haematococci]